MISRKKMISLHEASNTISLDEIETPQFNNTRRRVVTQIDADQPKIVLPKIKLGNNQNILTSNMNERKLKLTGAKEAFFRPRYLNRLPQLHQKQILKKAEVLSQPEIYPISSYNKASTNTLHCYD